MPCPHNEISIVQRSQRQSAVAAAAYQSGEKLFCDWWMGWRFTTSFWAEKKQETFFRFPAWCAAVWAAGI